MEHQGNTLCSFFRTYSHDALLSLQVVILLPTCLYNNNDNQSIYFAQSLVRRDYSTHTHTHTHTHEREGLAGLKEPERERPAEQPAIDNVALDPLPNFLTLAAVRPSPVTLPGLAPHFKRTGARGRWRRGWGWRR